ncbi:MAG: hypothetical protein KI785_14700 [Devosiaceae bacterium]|nr:hypothetical protein [Devosiaceae bacterium MH13]
MVNALIGIDIGTSSVKAVLSRDDGALLDSFEASHAMARPVPGAAEQDPLGWLRLVEAALDRFAGHAEASSVKAIGITSQVNTHVFCDVDLRPLAPAITWQDTRPATQAEVLDARIREAEKIAALGAPIHIDASHAVSRMAWVAETEPEVWAATAHVLAPKDFVIAQLTGAVHADPLASIGLVGTDHQYAEAILALQPRAADVLPPLRDPLAVGGTVRSGRPFAGVPVAQGTMDAWAAMFGVGVSGEAEAMYLSGTSDVLGLIAQNTTGEPGVIVFPPWRGITLHAAPTQSGGASLAWVAKLLGREVGALEDLAAAHAITGASPLFLPHLEGERAPLWDAGSRGGFAGLSSVHDASALTASVMEGVAFSARMALDAVSASAGQPIERLRLGGGGARSDVWCQIRANALGRSLHRVSVEAAGAAGALAMAAVAAGLAHDLRQSTEALISVGNVFEPDPHAHAIASERFEAFKELYSALRPIAGKLSGAG